MKDTCMIKAFVENIGLSGNAQQAVIPICEKILKAFVEEYDIIKSNAENDSLIRELADNMHEEPDIVMLAVSILLGIDAHDLYMERNISEEIYWASMRDIAIWEKTCERMRGHVGLYEYCWIINFLKADIVRLHRLEFHIITYNEKNDWNSVKPGDKVINTHIPEDGPLYYDDVIESYRRAYRYFNCSGKQAFVCESWLLYPGNYEFLSEKSNIRRFMDDFDITRKHDTKCSSDLWRVFGPCESFADPSKLPDDTELQRNMKKYLEEHDCTTGGGFGIFYFDGENVIK